MEAVPETSRLRNSNDQVLGEARDYQYSNQMGSQQQEYLSDEDPSSVSHEQEEYEEGQIANEIQDSIPNAEDKQIGSEDNQYTKDGDLN